MVQGSVKNKSVCLKRAECLTRYTHTNIHVTVTLRFEDDNNYERAIRPYVFLRIRKK